jgi:hypothetical protein
MRVVTAILAMLATAIAGCTPKPMTAADVDKYTSLRLCNGTVVRDLTTPDERDATPGFSFHVDLALPPACRADFENQLATLAGADCIAADCFVEDTSVHGATKKHTIIMTRALGGTRYDLRFYE